MVESFAVKFRAPRVVLFTICKALNPRAALNSSGSNGIVRTPFRQNFMNGV